MVCIYCSSPTSVVNSRHQRRDNAIWRRRKCGACTSLFTTLERAGLETGLRIQHGDKMEPFDRDQLFISIYESCRHRPTALHDSRNLTQQIINCLLEDQTTPGLILRDQLVLTSHRILKKFDVAAATVFGAYHPIAR